MSCGLRLSFLLLIIAAHSLNAQENYSDGEKRLFSLAMETNIREYNRKAENAFLDHDLERVESLFDSLVQFVVKDSYLDNFKVTRYKRKKVHLHDFKKPIFLVTYSDWYPFGTGEIAALNQIAAKHSREIDFLVLFFDPKWKVKKYSREFIGKINLLYVDERSNKFDRIIKSMKHSFGVPTVFYIDENKRFVNVGRMPAHHYTEDFETSFTNKYSYFLDGVAQLKKTHGEFGSLVEKEKDSVEK